MADTKLVICEKCLGTGHVNGGNENSTWSKTCENCHGIGFSRVPMTNADHIRAMSDEELAEFLGDWAQRHRAWMCDSQGECLAWLQEPAQDGEGDD